MEKKSRYVNYSSNIFKNYRLLFVIGPRLTIKILLRIKNGIKSLDSTLKYIKLFLKEDSSYSNLLDYANILTVTGTVYRDRALKAKSNVIYI